MGGFITFWKSSAVFAPTLEYLPSSLTFSSDCIANGSSSLIPFEYILLSRFRTKVSNVFRSRQFTRQLHWILFFLEFSRVKNIRNFTGETLSRNIWRSRRNGKCPPIFARSAVTKLYFNLFPFSCSRSFHLRSRYCYFNEVSRRGETVLKRFSTIVSVITGTRLRLHFISCFINFQRSSNPRSNCR